MMTVRDTVTAEPLLFVGLLPGMIAPQNWRDTLIPHFDYRQERGVKLRARRANVVPRNGVGHKMGLWCPTQFLYDFY
jgi:hypothetical protein